MFRKILAGILVFSFIVSNAYAIDPRALLKNAKAGFEPVEDERPRGGSVELVEGAQAQAAAVVAAQEAIAAFAPPAPIVVNAQANGVPAPELFGDLNGDLIVDRADLAIMVQSFGKVGGASPRDGDLNYDGTVSLADVVILQRYFGSFIDRTAPWGLGEYEHLTTFQSPSDIGYHFGQVMVVNGDYVLTNLADALMNGSLRMINANPESADFGKIIASFGSYNFNYSKLVSIKPGLIAIIHGGMVTVINVDPTSADFKREIASFGTGLPNFGADAMMWDSRTLAVSDGYVHETQSGAVYFYDIDPESPTFGQLKRSVSVPLQSQYLDKTYLMARVGGYLAISVTTGGIGGSYEGEVALLDVGAGPQAQVLRIWQDPREPGPGNYHNGYGSGLASDGTILAVGAPSTDGSTNDRGIVYLYDANPASQTFGSTLKIIEPPAGISVAGFGSGMAFKNKQLFVRTWHGDVFVYDADPNSPNFGNLAEVVRQQGPYSIYTTVRQDLAFRGNDLVYSIPGQQIPNYAYEKRAYILYYKRSAISINDGETHTSNPLVTLNLSAMDDHSDIAQMEISVSVDEGLTYSQYQPYQSSMEVALPSWNGTHTVIVKLRDEAGNVTTFRDDIIVDTLGPEGAFAYENERTYEDPYNLEFDLIRSVEETADYLFVSSHSAAGGSGAILVYDNDRNSPYYGNLISEIPNPAITAPPDTYFGWSLAAHDNKLYVRSRSTSRAVIEVFDITPRSPSFGSRINYITLPETDVSTLLHYNFDVVGDMLVVGIPAAAQTKGRVYVYDLRSPDPSQDQPVLVIENPWQGAYSLFGQRITRFDDRHVVIQMKGIFGPSTESGVALIYDVDPSSQRFGEQRTVLSYPNGITNYRFEEMAHDGKDVFLSVLDLDTNTRSIYRYHLDFNVADDPGALHAYLREVIEAPEEEEPAYQFGSTLAASSGRLAVSSLKFNEFGRVLDARVHIFDITDEYLATPIQTLEGTEGDASGYYGRTLYWHRGNLLVVGGPLHEWRRQALRVGGGITQTPTRRIILEVNVLDLFTLSQDLKMAIAHSGQDFTEYVDYQPTLALDLLGPPGLKTIKVRLKDLAGNVSEFVTQITLL